VAGNGRLLFVWKTEFGDAFDLNRGAPWPGFRQGKKSIENGAGDVLSFQRRGQRTGDQLTAGAHEGDFIRLALAVQKHFLGLPALVTKAFPTIAGHGVVLARKLQFGVPGQCQIDIVAPQNQVVAYGNTLESRAAVLHRPQVDQREVRRSAAHIADQHEFIGFDKLGPLPFMGHQPTVKGRQGFLQKNHRSHARRGGRLKGQLAGDLIEGCRHGDDHHLILEPGLLLDMGPVPGPAQVLEVGRRRRHRRHFLNLGAAAPWKDGGLAIGLGVAQPAFGG